MKKIINLLSLGSLLVSCGYDSRGDVHRLYKQLEDAEKTIKNNKDKISEVDSRLDSYMITVEEATNALEFELSELEINFQQLEINISDMVSRLDILENKEPKIVDIIKPCPTSKEVLLELDTGEMLGYFENGNKRYLSVLEAGNYKTTDGTGCNFSVE